MSSEKNDYQLPGKGPEKPWLKDLAIFSAIISEVVGLPLIGLFMGRWAVEKLGIASEWAYLVAVAGFVIAIFRIRRYRKP